MRKTISFAVQFFRWQAEKDVTHDDLISRVFTRNTSYLLSDEVEHQIIWFMRYVFFCPWLEKLKSNLCFFSFSQTMLIPVFSHICGPRLVHVGWSYDVYIIKKASWNVFEHVTYLPSDSRTSMNISIVHTKCLKKSRYGARDLTSAIF